MSVASFIAAVRASKVPTRTELLDAADALDTRPATEPVEPSSADELREARAAQAAAETDAKWWADRAKLHEERLARIVNIASGRGTLDADAKPMREQFSPCSLPAPTGFKHGESKR